MSVKVSMNVVRSIIGRHIQESINKTALIDAITKTVDSHALEMLVDICVAEEEYLPFNMHDIVMFKDNWNINHLDHGLCDGHDNMFGIITGSDNYGDEFNPYYYKLNLLKFDLNDKNETIMLPIDKYSTEISRVMPEKAEDLINIWKSTSKV
jgi:hypothetical protein